MIRDKPKIDISRQNIAFGGMIIGMFMAILDIQIVASSLPVIAAGLSATPDELSWVQTSYIIAEVVIIPLTGFTAKLLSTRISYTIAAFGFTVMSILCATATNINSMIVFRALQGFFGGAMIPTVFATIFLIFEPKQRPLVTVIIGLVVTMAPTLGPTVGGYITEYLSWHFMFLLNVIPGIIVCYVVYNYADFDKPDYTLLKNLDYVGAFFLITSLGTLQYILEEGNRKLWFESNEILALSIYVAFGLCMLVYHELTTAKPVLDFHAFRNRNFTLGCILSGVLGVGLYGGVFLLPVFLGGPPNLNTIQIGIIMGVMGVSQFASAPLAGNMMKMGVDRRIMMAIGFGLFGFGCHLNSFLTPESRFHELLLPQLVRGFSIMFCFVPINDLALGALPRDKVQDASGLYNLMRNLGGAFGLAIINSKITNNTRIYRDVLSSNVTATNPLVQNFTSGLENSVAAGLSDPSRASYEILNNLITRDAFIISINNIFAYISVMFAIALLLVPFFEDTGHVEGAGH